LKTKSKAKEVQYSVLCGSSPLTVLKKKLAEVNFRIFTSLMTKVIKETARKLEKTNSSLFIQNRKPVRSHLICLL
jgi:hypothetical protein